MDACFYDKMYNVFYALVIVTLIFEKHSGPGFGSFGLSDIEIHVLEFYMHALGLVLVFCDLLSGWVLGRITDKRSTVCLAC